MVAYRFLRPDDMPLIVHAYNTCYRIHFPELPAMDLEAMKTEVLERNVWSSSCMVAWEDGEAVAILVGAKRIESTCLMYLGVKPGYQRRGIASHILRSLSSKLAILGPPHLVAEVPENNIPIQSLLEKLGYEWRDTLSDFELTANLATIQTSPAIVHIPAEHGLRLLETKDEEIGVWDRTVQAMRNLKDKLLCLALLSPDAIVACLLYCRDKNGNLQIIRTYWSDLGSQKQFFGVLLRTLRQVEDGTIIISKFHPREGAYEDLIASGFERQKNWRVFRCEAQSFESIE